MFEGFFSSTFKAPEFPEHFEWINTDNHLTIANLKGSIVVLDFWTYCCINCMHTLPVLSSLEEKFQNEPVVFIGVHSGKFFAEQDAQNIKKAVGRYEIKHPVIVDQDMTIWKKYQIRGWPAIVIIDPKGNIVYHQSGEGQKESINDMIDVLLQKAKQNGTIRKEPLKIKNTHSVPNSLLSYPGKISISNEMIAISDSNHNRILILDMNGKRIHTIGNGKSGLKDGSFEDCQFFRPQGVCWKDDVLYVADTENHSIRKITLDGKVSTIAGTGTQGPWMSRGGEALTTPISSPWDISSYGDYLFVAMAGTHQIWVYDIINKTIFPFAGTGQEGIIDGDMNNSNLAQPSGVFVNENKVYFADSETSSIRFIDLKTKKLSTVAGRGLFDFGHEDGKTDSALFQHPLGLCVEGNSIFIADTYNSSIRVIDTMHNKVYTLIGKTKDGKVCKPDDPSCSVLPLYEPSDCKYYKKNLYIADTNNHLIRVFDIDTNELSIMEIS